MPKPSALFCPRRVSCAVRQPRVSPVHCSPVQPVPPSQPGREGGVGGHPQAAAASRTTASGSSASGRGSAWTAGSRRCPCRPSVAVSGRSCRWRSAAAGAPGIGTSRPAACLFSLSLSLSLSAVSQTGLRLGERARFWRRSKAIAVVGVGVPDMRWGEGRSRKRSTVGVLRRERGDSGGWGALFFAACSFTLWNSGHMRAGPAGALAPGLVDPKASATRLGGLRNPAGEWRHRSLVYLLGLGLPQPGSVDLHRTT